MHECHSNHAGRLRPWLRRAFVALGAVALLAALGAAPATPAGAAAWWVYPLGLFWFCFALGIIAVMAGVGGGVFYVPMVATLFPFHLDFVRASGIMIASAGALSAGSGLLRRGLASLRIALPMSVVGTIASAIGVRVGLAVPVEMVRTAIGVVVCVCAGLMMLGRKRDAAPNMEWDALGRALRIEGAYVDDTTGEVVRWRVHRTALGFAIFVGVAFLGGMFGMGAGWASVLVLTLVMGVPIKVAAATSNFLILMTGVSAFWVYLGRGCVIPLIAVPSMAGLMLGAQLSVKLLARAKATQIRVVIVVVLLFVGIRMVWMGIGG